MLPRAIALSTLILSGFLALVPLQPAQAGTEVPITRINFAGAGGDFKHRAGTFVVPDLDTSISAYGGKLRRYDVHLAKMIEITYDQWCKPNPGYEGVYWNYQAENGNRFMGQFYISCTTARKAVQTYGLGRPERTFIYHRGQGPERVEIPVLDLNGNKIPHFQQFVQTLRPQCIDTLCPGNTTGERY